MNTEARLREAIEAGEVLKVVYNGGSQPGAMREVAPISIKNGKVRARCFTSNAVKSFVIEKITILQEGNNISAVEWNPDAEQVQRYESINDLSEKEMDALLALGWHVESDDNCLSLHRRFKNGKPMKGADVSIDYEEFTYDLVVGLDGELHEENRRKRQRPWSVRGKNQGTRSYGSLDKAAGLFLEWAESLAPSRS
ncbi:MAG TPA: hypothetical protein ENJ51_10250 [Leucothrix mucor]|uniref:Uncharacterized protein n=1 Tax=Leucothrix mucor TaxID=45248 RepID=A0A7V2T112_LEUMU|nr:hypothetical protein [Leucothrix mucor]